MYLEPSILVVSFFPFRKPDTQESAVSTAAHNTELSAHKIMSSVLALRILKLRVCIRRH